MSSTRDKAPTSLEEMVATLTLFGWRGAAVTHTWVGVYKPATDTLLYARLHCTRRGNRDPDIQIMRKGWLGAFAEFPLAVIELPLAEVRHLGKFYERLTNEGYL